MGDPAAEIAVPDEEKDTTEAPGSQVKLPWTRKPHVHVGLGSGMLTIACCTHEDSDNPGKEIESGEETLQDPKE